MITLFGFSGDFMVGKFTFIHASEVPKKEG
jgi:hypothetical protein